ncbi:MAG: pantetheine-phosphate adenylyltransferase [Flavobacteriales bacterium]|nr:pantetheine-phosphate adenylyltransferase [Flavobacteriales bacterium]|tara:strand:- start:3272 stop:3742 length:471 start_codon:yes stop_codon:yes gene_type:complete
MKNNYAIFPGSFDPITLGHISIIHNSLKIFPTIIVAIGVNNNKNNMYSLTKRKELIESVFQNEQRILIKEYQILTVDFCKKNNANHIIRGVRNTQDFKYERDIALANEELDSNIKTIFIPAKKEHIFISSTIVREIITHKGDLTSFLHPQTINQIT